MKFESEENAQLYALKATSKHATENDLLKRIEDYKRYQDAYANDQEKKQYWHERAKATKSYLNSEYYKSGRYHIGIDELILDIIEIRAIIFSFQTVKTNCNPFETYMFHSQWLSGCTYKIFASYGKLLSGHKDDHSLKNVWNNVSHYIKDSSLTSIEEVDKLSSFINGINNNTSNPMRYRNKVIAHNEQLPKVQWTDLDYELKGLCRIWSLITMWCSTGIIAPFYDNKTAFSGLESVVSSLELSELKNARQEYIDNVRRWCKASITTNISDNNNSPFAEISFGFNV
ncbi:MULTISPECIES: hypothetical protein [Aeromonas]|uniref:hypothetical protein n=1 Tax=Aeromonas veronii TaxID=654 RepID=UPI000AAC0274|nr:hypothetical protein [Aeromonas veronii]